ncbi:MAG: hypothetical protein RL708_1589 [Bacteroidota bacterium]|jgi:hypothetical protein
MKKALPILFFLIAMQMVCTAQFTDKYWLVGRHVGLDFNSGLSIVNINEQSPPSLTNSSSSICDRNGNLLFYCSASKIYNKNRQIMPNGSGFNHGTFSDNYINTGFYPLFKGVTIVPFPKDTTKFYVFYENMEWSINGLYLPEKLMYLIVDMKLNGGLGDVTLKEQVVINNDTLSFGELMAVKHGNGQDWWVVCRKFKKSVYYSVLIDQNGVHIPISQNIGLDFNQNLSQNQICNISLSGTKMAFLYQSAQSTPTQLPGQLDLFDFDRCTGTFKNNISIPLLPNDSCYFLTTCYSPNEKYLYVSDGSKVWQLNLASSNILSSRILIGARQSGPQYFFMKIGIDKKIYISLLGSYSYLHFINSPDSFGLACHFFADTIFCNGGGHYADGSLPNNANYVLGALPNCPLGIEQIEKANEELQIFPNPCGERLFVSSDKLLGNTIVVSNVLGQACIIPPFQRELGGFELNISNLPIGIYFIKATDTNGNIKVAKFVKQ